MYGMKVMYSMRVVCMYVKPSYVLDMYWLCHACMHVEKAPMNTP